MLTAVIVGLDTPGASALRATLQQTGLVRSVKEWEPDANLHPAPGEPMPDFVLLHLSAEPEPFFAFSAHLRNLRPTIHIIACSALPPDQQMLLQAMRNGVQEFLTEPITMETLRSAITQLAAHPSSNGSRATEKLIVVAGAKGGVGTSTVAVNLSVQAADLTKKRVALFDFARPFGHLSLLLDLKPRHSIRDALENIDHLDANFLGGLVMPHKSGLHVLAGAAHAEDWRRVTIPALARIVNVGQTAFDLVIVDAGVVDPSEWAPLMRLARANLMVAEPSLLALWTLERHLAAAASAGLDHSRIHLVINRWLRNDDAALANVEKNLKQPIHARLPNDYAQVSAAVTLGMPLSGSTNNPLVSSYRSLAASVTGQKITADENRGTFSSLFSSRK